MMVSKQFVKTKIRIMLNKKELKDLLDKQVVMKESAGLEITVVYLDHRRERMKS